MQVVDGALDCAWADVECVGVEVDLLVLLLEDSILMSTRVRSEVRRWSWSSKIRSCSKAISEYICGYPVGVAAHGST